MDEKIVVIGSNSFSGSHFVHHALSQGSSVLGISYSPELSIPFTPYHWKKRGAHNFSCKQVDPGKHLEQTSKIINDYRPDYIIHFPADGHIEIYHHFKNAPFLKKYVYVSNQHDRNKTKETLSLENFHPIAVAQSAEIYGPGQQVHALVPKIILSILLEKKIPLHGGGHAVRSFIHVDDAVSGTLQAARQGTPGEAYHLSASRFISIRDLVSLICRRMNVAFENAVTIVEDRPGKDAAYLLDSTKSHRELDWKPTVELEEGIDSVIAWAQEWLPALKNHPFDLED